VLTENRRQKKVRGIASMFWSDGEHLQKGYARKLWKQRLKKKEKATHQRDSSKMCARTDNRGRSQGLMKQKKARNGKLPSPRKNGIEGPGAGMMAIDCLQELGGDRGREASYSISGRMCKGV